MGLIFMGLMVKIKNKKSAIKLTRALVILLIGSTLLFSSNLGIIKSFCAQTSNAVFFLPVGCVWCDGKSNELIPTEGPAIWHIKTNFDNECLYIFFDIVDTTNPDSSNLDKLYFYIDLKDSTTLSEATVFGYSVQRNGDIKYYRYIGSLGRYQELTPPTNGSFGIITISEDWKVYFKFNYTLYGFSIEDRNWTIGFMAYYIDHCIGSFILEYRYPSESSPLERISWAKGYFIDCVPVSQSNTVLIWILVVLTLAGMIFVGYYVYNKISWLGIKKGDNNDYSIYNNEINRNLLEINNNEDSYNDNNDNDSFYDYEIDTDYW